MIKTYTYNLIKKFFFNKKISNYISKISSEASVDQRSTIGRYTYIGKNVNITSTIIGRYCSIANNVSIGIGEHDIYNISTSAIFYDNKYSLLTKKNCIIKNDVWIGVDSIIRRGVVIGNGAVIGANSFVNIDIPDFAVFAGNPARFIKYRFPQPIITKIIESHWWDYDFDEAKKIIGDLYNEIY